MAKKKPDKKICIKCSKEQALINFYTTKSDAFADGRISICKTCIKKELNEDNIDSVRKVLRQLDKPFISSVWRTCLDSDKETFGWYLRQISTLTQYKGMTYENSDDSFDRSESNDKNDNDEDEDETKIPYLQVSPELKTKWGHGYSNREYLNLEKFYNDMMFSHDNINTPSSKELLKLMCKMNLKMEKALENDDITGFSKLHAEYQKLLQSSGWRPIDRKSGSEASGIVTFSQIFEEIEKHGFIEPYNKEYEQDIIDRSITYIINYQRKLLSMESLPQAPDDTPTMQEGEDDES